MLKCLCPQPSQNVRDKYKAKCGFAPTVITAPQRKPVSSQAYQTAVTRAESQVYEPMNTFLNAGDIVAVIAGTIDGKHSKELWWLAQLTRDLTAQGPTSDSQIYANWLEYQSQNESHQTFKLSESHEITLYYGNIIMDSEENPFIIEPNTYMKKTHQGDIHFQIDSSILEDLTHQSKGIQSHESSESEIDISDEEDDIKTRGLQDLECVPRTRSRDIYRKGMKYNTYKDMLKGGTW